MRWVLVLAAGMWVVASLSAVGSPWRARVAAAADAPGALVVAQADDVKPLAQVLETIGKRFPGHALDAQLVKQGEPKYRVKWLGEDGKVREVTSDARSGKILEVR